MSEGVLVIGITLTIYGMLVGDKRLWLAGLGVSIAMNAKHSAIVLLPVGFLAVCWLQEIKIGKLHNIANNILQYLSIILIMSILNPIIWKYPIDTLKAMVTARMDWVETQRNTLELV